MGSPNGLLHRGWRSTELKKGDQITVEGYGAKDRTNIANARTVTLPDGRKLFGGFQSTPGAPVKEPRFRVVSILSSTRVRGSIVRRAKSPVLGSLPIAGE